MPHFVAFHQGLHYFPIRFFTVCQCTFLWVSSIPRVTDALTLCMLGNFSCFCCLLTFFNINFLKKILSGTLSECQTVWIKIRTNRTLVLIWVKTVCKGYHQTTKAAASKERVEKDHLMTKTISCKIELNIFMQFLENFKI